MALLDKLEKGGSLLTNLDGKTPPSYNGISQYPEGLKTSQLDLDGKSPLSYDRVSRLEASLKVSQLDLDGKTPEKYLDNKPS